MATLEQIIDEARALSPAEKRELRRALDCELEQELEPERTQSAQRDGGDEQIRQRRMEWLKLHREEFAGQYVALDGEVLVGHGATIREAHQQAKERGVENPFLVRLTSENEVLFAGW